ncbi:SMP-30/gluconolactonase/LRE family protein [Muricoccus pecuniae]|nr:L-dopachrome tautomerase-related protein [Roseomonas pecuniae]
MHASRRPLLLASGALALSAALPALGQTRSETRAGTGAGSKPPAMDFSRGARLEQVAAFPDRQITGITVSRSGRIFVCLPRWGQDVPVSVAELAEGQLRPYPDEGWNAWRNASPAMPERRFVCVQSVVVDPQDNLWVLDPAAPDMMGPVKGGPKLVRIDLRTNTVAKVIPVPERVAPPGSYLNDLRFSPDGRTAYITDSGIKGALVVLDTASGAARRVLDGHPSTQFEEGLVPMADGQPLRRPNGRTMQSAADGIAISPDGATLYWQALTGRTLFSIPTAALRDARLSPDRLGAQVRRVAGTHVADGLWIDAAGRLYVTNPETSAVEMAPAPGQPLSVLVRDDRLRWPDTFAQGPDGALFVTTSHIQDSPWFKPEAKATPSEVWRIVPA